MSRIVDNCTKICIKIMMAVMMLAPVGVFCLMADATGSFGYDVLMKIITSSVFISAYFSLSPM